MNRIFAGLTEAIRNYWAFILLIILTIAAIGLFLVLAVESEASCHSRACWGRVHHARVIDSVEKKIDRITPYNCGTRRGVIQSVMPCKVISTESAMVRAGAWRAVNSKGCLGPYQFCGWKVPWPVMVRDKYERLKRMLKHHRQAVYLKHRQLAYGECHWCYPW